LIALLIPQAIKVANQWERAVVLRLGKLSAIRGPGFFVIVPFIDQVAIWIDQRIQTTEINAEKALSEDTVPVNIDAVIFWQVHDPERAALEIVDYRQAITRVAQTSLREMVGSSLLSTLLSERRQGDQLLRDEIGRKTAEWGVAVAA
jgi:regulator of protease activity HflC (stomatin/prohibitin superfamily)